MVWSEQKRKKIWGKRYNPAIVLGIFLMIIALNPVRYILEPITGPFIVAKLIYFFTAVFFLVQGGRKYNEYK